jgi:serine/threonine protein kinase
VSREERVRELLERFVEQHVRTGERLAAGDLCGDARDLIEPLQRRIDRYLELDRRLDGEAWPTHPGRRCERCGATLGTDGACPRCRPASAPPDPAGPLPSFEGFETIERLGAGGMGEVYKLRDRRLGRLVAAKVVRAGAPASFAEFLAEAQSLALFQDERIVTVHEFRAEADPPVILMEHVDGFELGRIGPSLEFIQRARLLVEVCEAVHRAHGLGLQHRDLKPANIMLDAGLRPKILDFGLSGADPRRGHLRGTPHYLAPEQLDPGQPLDGRVDVYALGVILYELLCGALPYAGETLDEIVARAERGAPRLPVELDPRVPEPLQAIALKAMERNPDDRYPSAREMALDLRRWIEGRPVSARPTYYSSALGKRLRPHLEQIEEWLRLKLIYPHEAGHLRSAYHRLEARDDDWIVESRVLSWSQIALYLGAFLLVLGGLLYFVATRLVEEPLGVLRPLLAFGLPFAGLNAVAHVLYQREQKAVAVAFALAGVLLLPLLLLVVFLEGGIWTLPEGNTADLLWDLEVSNRQLQVAVAAACAWAFALAWRTRTAALSSVFTVLLVLLAAALLGDLGLRSWVEEGHWDRVALHLSPLAPLLGWLGYRLELARRAWFSRPLYVGGGVLYALVLELLALDGKLCERLGITFGALAGPDADPVLLDTLIAMSMNGVAFYALAWALDRYGSEFMRAASYLLFVVSPFAILEPLGYLVKTGDYSQEFDWFYLGLALTIAVVSQYRQRRSFYFAGLLNTGAALWLITDHHEWWDRPAWAVVVLLVGLAVLSGGWAVDRAERTGRRPGG